MIRNIANELRIFVDSCEETHKNYLKEKAEIERVYNPAGQDFSEKMDAAKAKYDNAIQTLKTTSKAKIDEDFNSVFLALGKVVAVLPSSEVMNAIDLIQKGVIDDTEAKCILESRKTCYMESKLLNRVIADREPLAAMVVDAIYSENNFVLAETVQSGVADYQKQVNEFYRVFNPDVSTGSDLQLAFLYNGVLADGKPVEGVANMVETFLNAYQESSNND